MFFDEAKRDAVARALERLAATRWDDTTLRAHAASYDEAAFASRLHAEVGATTPRAGSLCHGPKGRSDQTVEGIGLSAHTGRAERFENGATGCVVIEVTDPRRVDALEERRTPGVVQARRP